MKPLIIAHRGASIYSPENTMVAFEKAVTQGCDMIEIDLHITKDGELVVIHDDTLDRTTNQTGRIRDYTLEELKKADAGAGQHIPSFQEVIDFLPEKVGLVVELKELGLERRVVEQLSRNPISDRVIVTSFFHPAVRLVKSLFPQVRTAVITNSQPINANSLAIDARADALWIFRRYVTKEMVESAHENSLELYVWYVNDLNEIRRIVELEVDGILTGMPDVMKRILSSTN